MNYHDTLSDYTEKLNKAIELIDIELIQQVCRDGVALIRDNEPLNVVDIDLVEAFTNSHNRAEKLFQKIKDELIAETSRSKHARKGIKQYKGVSNNV